MGARPLAGPAPVLRPNGLSRHASRKTRLTRCSASIFESTWVTLMLAVLTAAARSGRRAPPSARGSRRNEPVHAVDLDAVAGVEEEPGARLVQLAGEFGYLFVHPALVKITPLDHLETERAQDISEIAGVVYRIRQAAAVLVIGIADDQCNAGLPHDPRC